MNPTSSSSRHFFGRAAALRTISRWLSEEAYRLVTILGPGGVGKTRLAREVVTLVTDAFGDGTCFADLAAVEKPEEVAPYLSHRLELPLTGARPPLSVLESYLGERRMLLVLDNCEHLLSDTAPAASFTTVVMHLLDHAPRLAIAITSRQPLNLAMERRYPLDGLPYPAPKATDPGQYDAVALFAMTARRMKPDFDLETEAVAVARICRLVEGIPLALELAAGWVQTLSAPDIAAEIEKSTDILVGHTRDRSLRHQTMQTVFDTSWQLLNDADRRTLMQLSIFRGGFNRSAARSVAAAGLPRLDRLIQRSLLRRQGDRYHVLELIRQDAASRLSAYPELAAETRQAHARHFGTWLAEMLPALCGGSQTTALEAIALELDNLRQAWREAVENRDVELVAQMARPLAMYLDMRNRYHELDLLLGAAAERLGGAEPGPARDRALMAVMVDLGWNHVRQGRLSRAREMTGRCEALYETTDRHSLPGLGSDPAALRGIIALIEGEFDAAAAHGQVVVDTGRQQSHVPNQMLGEYVLIRAAFLRGRYDEAHTHARQAYRLARQIEDHWFEAYVHNELGNIAAARGEMDAARHHFDTSYQLRRRFGDREGMGTARNSLGRVALEDNDPASAGKAYAEAATLFREISNQGGLATALVGMGRAACARRQWGDAGQYLAEAVQIAANTGLTALQLSLLTAAAFLFLGAGDPRRGATLLALVRRHPAAEHATRAAAETLLEQCKPRLGAEAHAVAIARGRELTLDAALDDTQLWLNGWEPRSPDDDDDVPSPLAEPLTDRETQVLGLIAQGLTNREIADQLFLSVGTVKSYTSHIYGKLHVGNRTEAVARARDLGLLSD